MRNIEIFDSTLRDGAQSVGISFSVEDKLNIVKSLDRLGVKYIEAGNPGSNPKDLDFFNRVQKLKLQNSTLVAFGSTRRKGIKPEEDLNCQAILSADTSAVAIFGKSWDLHVTGIINTTLEENLNMIEDTVEFFKSKGKIVIYDAEHFFDGYSANPDYALGTVMAAVRGGADYIVLCDTNGGCLPDFIHDATKKVSELTDVKIGIHCHNDMGLAVANSLSAVKAGACQIQGTFLGYGERCGNANLSTIIPTLKYKLGLESIPDENIPNLTQTARYISEISNISLDTRLPYVGSYAFSHKAGMHADGVLKISHSFEHINPELVGNQRRFMVSEISGRTSVLKKVNEIFPHITRDSEELSNIISKIKELEHEGYHFEGAEGSLNLIIYKAIKKYKPFFTLSRYNVAGEYPKYGEYSATATIKLQVNEASRITAAEGDGPVHALDIALRRALTEFYPQLDKVHLIDYKVRVMEPKEGTAAKVRVLITSTDGNNEWTTVGVSTDIIEASWLALVDSIEYKLITDSNSE